MVGRRAVDSILRLLGEDALSVRTVMASLIGGFEAELGCKRFMMVAFA
jgi:hypothetical protein